MEKKINSDEDSIVVVNTGWRDMKKHLHRLSVYAKEGYVPVSMDPKQIVFKKTEPKTCEFILEKNVGRKKLASLARSGFVPVCVSDDEYYLLMREGEKDESPDVFMLVALLIISSAVIAFVSLLDIGKTPTILIDAAAAVVLGNSAVKAFRILGSGRNNDKGEDENEGIQDQHSSSRQDEGE